MPNCAEEEHQGLRRHPQCHSRPLDHISAAQSNSTEEAIRERRSLVERYIKCNIADGVIAPPPAPTPLPLPAPAPALGDLLKISCSGLGLSLTSKGFLRVVEHVPFPPGLLGFRCIELSCQCAACGCLVMPGHQPHGCEAHAKTASV